jgi:hypothetical protein
MAMSGDELEFLQSLESDQKAAMPQTFAVRKGKDGYRLAFNRKLQNVSSFRDWTIVTMKPVDFKNMVKAIVTSVAAEDEMHD